MEESCAETGQLHLVGTFVHKLCIYRMEILSSHKGTFTELAYGSARSCRMITLGNEKANKPSSTCRSRSIWSVNTSPLWILPLEMSSSSAKADIVPLLRTCLCSYWDTAFTHEKSSILTYFVVNLLIWPWFLFQWEYLCLTDNMHFMCNYYNKCTFEWGFPIILFIYFCMPECHHFLRNLWFLNFF